MTTIHVPERPYDLSWDITTACNLNCRFCYNRSGKADAAESPELMGIIQGNVQELQPLHLGIGGGEPLLSPYIGEVLEGLIEAMGKKTPMITINSMEIGSHESLVERVRTLNEQLPEDRIGFYISIHGMEDTHDSLVGRKGHFQEVMKSIELLTAYQVRFGMGIVPTTYNVGELDTVLAFAQRMGATIFNISQFVPIGKGLQKYNLTPQQYGELLTWVKTQNTLLNRRYVVTQERWIGAVDETLFKNELFVGCSAGIYYMGLRSNGDIVPCQLNKYVLGNIRHDRLREVWLNSPVLQKWRARDVKNKCGRCQFLYKCGGCRCNAVAYTGDFLDEDPLCPFTHAELTERYALQRLKANADAVSHEPGERGERSAPLDLRDTVLLTKVPALSTPHGDFLAVRLESLDAFVELTGDARVIYELISEDTPTTVGDVKRQFEEKTGRKMPQDEFSDLVRYMLLELL